MKKTIIKDDGRKCQLCDPGKGHNQHAYKGKPHVPDLKKASGK